MWSCCMLLVIDTSVSFSVIMLTHGAGMVIAKLTTQPFQGNISVNLVILIYIAAKPKNIPSMQEKY